MRLRTSLLITLALICFAPLAQADDFSSTNFTLKDPVIAEPAAYGTSSNYGLWGVIPNIAPVNGTSTNFGVNPGFLAFSNVTMPTLSATASSTSFDLSWSAAVGSSVVTYEPGYATTIGGPYSFSATQTTRTATISGLTESTAYYLIIRVKEQSGGALLGYSNELAISTLSASATSSEESSDDESVSSGSVATSSVGWVFGPDGLVPASEGGSGTVLRPGDSVEVAPQLLRQFGFVFSMQNGVQVPLKGAMVELSRFDEETKTFRVWPNRKDAVVETDEYGLYSFLVPPGLYRIRAMASGYLTYAAPNRVVSGTGQLEQSIEMTPQLTVEVSHSVMTLMLIIAAVIAGVMLLVLLRVLLRR